MGDSIVSKADLPLHICAEISPVVDIVGVSGVGKTTFKKRLIRKTVSDSQIVCAAQWLKSGQAPPATLLQKCLMKWGIVIPGLRLQRPTSSRAEFETAVDALNIRPNQFAKFLALVLALKLEEKLDPVDYIVASKWFFNSMVKRVAVETKPNRRALCVVDEPLTYRPSLFGNGVPGVVNDIEQYYQNVPLPRAIIFIDAPTCVVVDRLMKRSGSGGKIALRHRQLSRQEIVRDTDWGRYVAITGIKILKERGLRILGLSGTASIDANVSLAQDFLRQLVERPELQVDGFK
jgi:GTPase SAR1 family protein